MLPFHFQRDEDEIKGHLHIYLGTRYVTQIFGDISHHAFHQESTVWSGSPDVLLKNGN